MKGELSRVKEGVPEPRRSDAELREEGLRVLARIIAKVLLDNVSRGKKPPAAVP